MKKIFFTYVLCGNSYTESIARIFFQNNLILIHRSNAKKIPDKIKKIGFFLLAYFIRYTFCLLPCFKFSLAIPHSANKYNLILEILAPHDIYLIDDGVTFEYWSKFHDESIANIINRYPECIELIGPRIPNWPIKYSGLFVNIILRDDALLKLVNIYSNLLYREQEKDKLSNSVCLLDDGQYSFDELNKIAIDFKEFCGQDHFHILMHPSRQEAKNNIPAEIFLIQNKGIKAVYGNASTVLFNIAMYNKDINLFTSSSSSEDLNESLKIIGVKFLTWNKINGFKQ